MSKKNLKKQLHKKDENQNTFSNFSEWNNTRQVDMPLKLINIHLRNL